MSSVEDFIYRFEGNQRKVMLYLHHLLANQLDLTAKIRYKIPFYYGKTWICYLNPIKDNKIELAFVRGNELSNSQGLLSNKGRKQVSGIDFENLQDIPKKDVSEIIHEAILLDETISYASKRSLNK